MNHSTETLIELSQTYFKAVRAEIPAARANDRALLLAALSFIGHQEEQFLALLRKNPSLERTVGLQLHTAVFVLLSRWQDQFSLLTTQSEWLHELIIQHTDRE